LTTRQHSDTILPSKKDRLKLLFAKWTFNSTDTLLGIEIINTVVYFVINRAGGVYLESLDLQPGLTDGSLGSLIHLDRKVGLTGIYDSANDWTTRTLPIQNRERCKRSWVIALPDNAVRCCRPLSRQRALCARAGIIPAEPPGWADPILCATAFPSNLCVTDKAWQ
jgi:hypothetical protein